MGAAGISLTIHSDPGGDESRKQQRQQQQRRGQHGVGHANSSPHPLVLLLLVLAPPNWGVPLYLPLPDSSILILSLSKANQG